jgi:nicotinamide mononucleotide adenylyltransferase
MPAKIELAGMRFNRLSVTGQNEIRKQRRYWLCVCDCGNEKWASSKLLRNGECGSCGCLRNKGTKDLSGKKFGRLLVTSNYKRKETPSNDKNKRYRFFWLCRCDCGNDTWVVASALKTQISCGCFRLQKVRLPKGQAAKNRVIRKYKWSAEQRSLTYKLTDEELMEIISKDCHYCGKKPTFNQLKGDNGGFHKNGVDRVDNKEGYELDNCVTCCTTCNKMKRVLGEKEFLQKIEQIYTHQITQDTDRRSIFLGRWQPFHTSHEALIRTRLDEGHPCLVLVRATPLDENNPYTLHETLQMIRAAFVGENVKVLPISDVSGIYYGRKVGYLVEEIDMPDSVKRISATKIRECLNNDDDTWRDFVNPKVAKVLEGVHAKDQAKSSCKGDGSCKKSEAPEKKI